MTDTPWHRPGRWYMNPSYWEPAVRSELGAMPARVRIIDCTLTEGDDAVGHQLNWLTRLGVAEKLNEVGVGAITLPSHARHREERDFVKAYEKLGLTVPLVAKGPGVRPPLRGDWKSTIDRFVDMGTPTISPIFRWQPKDTFSDFEAGLTKEQVLASIDESVHYMKSQGVHVIPWIDDAMRTRVDTAAAFYGALASAGADGVYVVDSRGNSIPTATRHFIGKIKAAVGSTPIYIQHHNDLGVATANAIAAVEAGAEWVDASVTGIGDRGGAVALEEVACLLEAYGVETGVVLDRLYEVGCYVRDAFGVTFHDWKPILGANWNKEEGLGHKEGGDAEEATIAIASSVVGRPFEGVIGAKILFGRERSSAPTSDPTFLRELLSDWGWQYDDDQFAEILLRARAALATSRQQGYLTIDQFRDIAGAVLDP